MRTITKLDQPDSLVEHRAKPGAVFDQRGLEFAPALPQGNPELPGEAKQELRERLVAEQHGLCCYCCNRIEASWNKMKIEHWEPISENPGRQLDYSNLMGACLGGEGYPPSMQHCDTLKGESPLSKNPSNPADRVEDSISYLSTGAIRSSDAVFNDEIGDSKNPGKLNLNQAFFCNNRIAELDAFIKAQTKDRDWSKSALERKLREWDGTEGGLLRPYSPVIVWFIKKKLRKL